jgi:uncharacterized damage-inducible protein DinB
MDREIARWVEFWDYLDGNFRGTLSRLADELTPEEIAFQPAATVASIGWNLRHLGEMLDYYLSRVFGAGPQVSPAPLVTMAPDSRDDGRFADLAAVGAYHDRVRPAYRRYLSGLTGADLTAAIERQGRRTITVGWAVAHIHEHESYHLGKCTLLRSLILERRKIAPFRSNSP